MIPSPRILDSGYPQRWFDMGLFQKPANITPTPYPFQPSFRTRTNTNAINNLWVFFRSSGWKGNRNILSPGGAFRPWQDRIGGKYPDFGAVAWVPQCTCPRPPFEKPNPGSSPGNQRIFRLEPMKGLRLILSCHGWDAPPGPPPASRQRDHWQIDNRPKSAARLGEAPLFKLRFIRIALGESLLNAHVCPHEGNGIPYIFGTEFPPPLNRPGQVLRR